MTNQRNTISTDAKRRERLRATINVGKNQIDFAEAESESDIKLEYSFESLTDRMPVNVKLL